MASFRLFGDDSGNRDYDADRNYTSSGRSRYFVYGTLLLEEREAALLTARIRELKAITFGTPNVEIKSNWLRIESERRKRFLEPFTLSEAHVMQFTEGLYSLLDQAPLHILGVVVDKLHMQEKYPKPWYPHTMAYEALMQRAVQAVPTGAQLSVTLDKTTGKTAKQTEYQQMIAAHHDKLRRNGSSLVKSLSFSNLVGPVRFVDSSNSELVQLADVVAYNIHRQFRDYGESWETPTSGQTTTLPMYPYFQRMARKFYTQPGGRVQGFGMVKCPLKTRVRWAMKPGS